MKIGIQLHPDFIRLKDIFLELIHFLEIRKHDLIFPDYTPKQIFKEPSRFTFLPEKQMTAKIDAMFSIGGDGTFLGAAKIVAGTSKPVLGIHLGGLGFLADVSLSNYKNRLTTFFNGNYKIEKRSVLSAKIKSQNSKEYYAFNEFLINKGHISSMIKIKTFVDDDYLNTYRSDGLLISTPTGSTAYSLSAGGPIITPHLNVTTITPLCPHSLSARPVVISSDQTVTVECCDLNKDVSLVVDGHERISLANDKKISIKKADFFLNIVRFEDDSFFQTLQKKLNWGIDSRGK